MSEEEIRPKFGNRIIDEKSDIFKHNAWDRVDWDQTQENGFIQNK